MLYSAVTVTRGRTCEKPEIVIGGRLCTFMYVKMAMDEAIPIGVMLGRTGLLPENMQEQARKLILSAELRTANSMIEQVHIMKQELDWVCISILAGLPKTTIYRKWKEFTTHVSHESVEETIGAEKDKASLTREQQTELINWIRDRHALLDCPTPSMVRQRAAELKYGAFAGGQKFSRMWWHRFKTEHSDVIGTVTAASIETGRTNVTVEQVQDYLSMLIDALSDIKSPRQIINMDETGFHGRIDKGRKRKCVFIRGLGKRPTFHEERQSTTLSLVATISMSGDSLQPLFLTKEEVKFQSRTLRLLKERLLTYQTPKGYQNEASMIYYLQQVIFPYIQEVRIGLKDATANVYLIMDNCASHLTPNVRSVIQQIDGLRVISLPPHSSHFLQMLDASLFGVLKMAYRNTRTGPEKPKYEAKLVRAFHAWHTACYPINIISCFQMTGLDYRFHDDGGFDVVLNMRKMDALMQVNCPDYQDKLLLDEEWDDLPAENPEDP